MRGNLSTDKSAARVSVPDHAQQTQDFALHQSLAISCQEELASKLPSAVQNHSMQTSLHSHYAYFTLRTTLSATDKKGVLAQQEFEERQGARE